MHVNFLSPIFRCTAVEIYVDKRNLALKLMTRTGPGLTRGGTQSNVVKLFCCFRTIRDGDGQLEQIRDGIVNHDSRRHAIQPELRFRPR